MLRVAIPPLGLIAPHSLFDLVPDATAMPGAAHQVDGTVVTGDARGRTLGFPTANLVPDASLLPADGVYAVTVPIGGNVYVGVATSAPVPAIREDIRSARALRL